MKEQKDFAKIYLNLTITGNKVFDTMQIADISKFLLTLQTTPSKITKEKSQRYNINRVESTAHFLVINYLILTDADRLRLKWFKNYFYGRIQIVEVIRTQNTQLRV